MNDIVFNRGKGGLGRALAGEDHISGLVAEMALANVPAALVAAGLYAIIYSVEDAEDLGITYSENQDNQELDSLVYQIEQIFQYNDKAVLHLAIADTTASKTVATELLTVQNQADGKIRQAVCLASLKDWAVGDLTPIQAACDTLEAEHKPLSVIYTCNFNALPTEDLRTLDNKNVSVCIGADGNQKGFELSEAYGESFTCAGALLGTLSGAKVHENPAWIGQFNINKNDTNEFDVLNFADGSTYKSVSTSQTDDLDNRGFIFLRKHIGLAGSYFNDSHTAIKKSSDYAFIENVRVIDKAVRQVRTFLLPSLNSPLYVNTDGTLTEDTIARFKNEAERPLDTMGTEGEISASEIIIDPEQDVLATSNLAITIKIVPVGVARNIKVNIGLAVRVNE